MLSLFVELCVRFWPYLAFALAIGVMAGWLSAARPRA